MSQPEKCPPISEELVAYLAEMFPDRCPDLDAPEAKMWADAGAARVVRYLREQRARQEQQSLTGPTLGRDASPRSMRFT